MFGGIGMPNYLDPQSQFVPTTIPIPKYINTPYARAYVLFQPSTEKMYPIDEGFRKGTIFPDLYDPYIHVKAEGGKKL